MKKITLLVIITTASVLIGCRNDLLDTAPFDSVGSEKMWRTESLADLGVVGVYNTLRYDYSGLNRWYLDQDGFTGMNRGTTTLTNGTVTASDAFFVNYWRHNYEGIHRANDAIKNLREVAPLSPDKKNRLLAECRFLRALFYFNLNQVFKGVPVYLEPVTVQYVNRGRETEQKVWEIVITDLTDCINESSLPNTYTQGKEFSGRVTKAAVYALRGKTYLFMKNFASAEADFRKAGESGPALFQGEYKFLFKETNEQDPEMVFSVQNIGVSGLGSVTQLYCGSRIVFGSGWNTYMPHPDFVDSFERKDGSRFNWNDFLPGFNSMTPAQRTVFFLRDGLTAAEINSFKNRGADMTKYLPAGNEERIRKVYEDRDPRLMALVVTPYSSFSGAFGTTPYTYTLRWPYRGGDTSAPFDLRTDTNSLFYYLWRKWVYEGASETPDRNYGPIDQPLIRYADVVLMLAEAINEQRFSDEAISLVNSVRTRAGVIALQRADASKPTYVSNQADLRERIRNERRWELALEGINLFDEMRWGTWKEKKFTPGNGIKQIWGTVTSPYSWRGDYLYNWAIPQTEVERNRNLIQNPGWIN